MRTTIAALVFLFAVPSTFAAEVALKTTDGLRLRATWHAPKIGKVGVIIALHMYRSNRRAWAPIVSHAKAKGLGLLMIDLRGHGQSSKQGKKDLSKRVKARDSALFQAMHLDVAAAVAFVKKKGFKENSIVLIGASVGCSVALHYVAKNPTTEIRAGILLTPGKNYLGVPSMKHITSWGKRPLLIASSQEEIVKGARALYGAMKHKSSGVLWQLPQTGIHGTRMFGIVPKFAKRLVDWARARLTIRK
jgi:alpha-beta hydrolase superfamily lysophospholipase